ncbi:MAG: recombinase family protein [Candidatus Sungbacteria bacterium]|nr:recombinase family protein [Candidatus Sungbacteria bacterium]
MPAYFLYARKSTDVEDKQVRSIEDQLAELRDFAKREGLNIIEEFIEKQSAKTPGRPIFNEMIARIERGEATGIVSWHPDRLARNSIDGGRIIYLVDTEKITSLKFPIFSFENTSQGKLMLGFILGMSKYYVDNLSENVKRGLRQKIKRGEYPSIAPVGYLNDVRTKTIVVNRKKAKVVKAAFELYAKNESRLEDISEFFYQHGVITKGNKRLFRNRVKNILTNPIYHGLFRYAGEVYEGKHEPIITKKLYDKVQEVLRERGKPDRKANDPKVFCGLLRCGSCGMMITAEDRVKLQKNGNIHNYTYYHCTKKSKTMKCPEPCIREEELDRQLSEMIQRVALPEEWANELLKMAEQDKQEIAHSSAAIVQETRTEIQTISQKLQRLLDTYLEQDIEREVYREEKANLLSRRKSLEENIDDLEHGRLAWLEPMREWIKEAQTLNEIALAPSLSIKKSFAQKIFGSNLTLHTREARGIAIHQWFSLACAKENFTENNFSSEMVPSRGIEPLF